MKNIGQPVMYLGRSDFGKFLKKGFAEYGKLIKEFNIKSSKESLFRMHRDINK